MKKQILVKLGLLAGALLLLSSFKKKMGVKSDVPLISQLDAPTGTQQVYSKVGTRLFDLNKNTVKVFDIARFNHQMKSFFENENSTDKIQIQYVIINIYKMVRLFFLAIIFSYFCGCLWFLVVD